jgi:hypothetical protein
LALSIDFFCISPTYWLLFHEKSADYFISFLETILYPKQALYRVTASPVDMTRGHQGGAHVHFLSSPSPHLHLPPDTPFLSSLQRLANHRCHGSLSLPFYTTTTIHRADAGDAGDAATTGRELAAAEKTSVVADGGLA